MDENRQGKSVTQLKSALPSDCALESASAVYLSVWNMDCPDCARWLHEGLAQVSGVLLLEVFYRQGVTVVIYDPSLTTTSYLLNAVASIGRNTCHYYGAEIIGQCPARQVLQKSEAR